MIFNIVVQTGKEALQIAEHNNLEQWKSQNSERYESPEIARTEDVYMSIKNNKLQIKCSLHKQYYKMIYGKLENDGLFTTTEARRALYTLFNMVGVSPNQARITYFEIGLNIPTENEPLQYIELIQSITTGKIKKEKEVFQDANFKKDRQKTTERYKSIKKVFKVYDKGFEKADRKRIEPTNEKILRIETIYRRQSIYVNDFFATDNLNRLTATFFHDWQGVEFSRGMTAEKGTRTSQIESAKKILLLGRQAYLEQAKQEFNAELLTEKQYRTIREFVRDWDFNKHKYKMLPTKHEIEYKEKLSKWFNLAKQ